MKKFLPVATMFLCVAAIIAITFLIGSLIYPMGYKDEIKRYASLNNLSPALVCAVVNVESGFDAKAVSKKGAVGLMQVMPQTASYISKSDITSKDLFAPQTNLDCGCKYLSYLMRIFSFDEAICAYNAGPTKVKMWLSDKQYSSDGVRLSRIPYKETRDYLNRVKQNYEHYKNRI